MELSTQAFTIRIWIEDTEEETGKATWRGYITHVMSGERCYIEDLDAISLFIVGYLEHMKVRTNLFWRIRRWMRRITAPRGQRRRL